MVWQRGRRSIDVASLIILAKLERCGFDFWRMAARRESQIRHDLEDFID